MQAGDENKMTHQGVNVLMYHQFLVTKILLRTFSVELWVQESHKFGTVTFCPKLRGPEREKLFGHGSNRNCCKLEIKKPRLQNETPVGQNLKRFMGSLHSFCCSPNRSILGAFHYAKDSANFRQHSNGKGPFGFFWPEYSGSPLEVVHLFRSKCSDRNLPFYFLQTGSLPLIK